MKIDRSLVEPRHQLDRRLRQPRLGITHSRGIIAVNTAKVSLTVDQHVTQAEVLGHANHCIINRTIAMRMILA